MVLMKKLYTYLFLIFFNFSASSFAEEIKEIEIEGMSLGKSLLKYISEEEIKATTVPDVYEDKFEVMLFDKKPLRYDWITATYKSNDKKYIIYGIAGVKDFPNNIENCYKEQDRIRGEISINLKNWGILILEEKENSTYKPMTYEDNHGHAISVACYNYPESPEINNLKLSLDAKEFKNYIKDRAIKAN